MSYLDFCYTGRMTLEEENARLRAENAELRQLVAHLQAQLAAALTRIADLEQQPAPGEAESCSII